MGPALRRLQRELAAEEPLQKRLAACPALVGSSSAEACSQLDRALQEPSSVAAQSCSLEAVAECRVRFLLSPCRQSQPVTLIPLQ